jgi:hypothetical protein
MTESVLDSDISHTENHRKLSLVRFSFLLQPERSDNARQRGQCICRLYKSSSAATTSVFGSYTCHLSTFTITLCHGCDLAYPYDSRGFVGAKMKTSAVFERLNGLGEDFKPQGVRPKRHKLRISV